MKQEWKSVDGIGRHVLVRQIPGNATLASGFRSGIVPDEEDLYKMWTHPVGKVSADSSKVLKSNRLRRERQSDILSTASQRTRCSQIWRFDVRTMT